ncbi:hypothetical protein [Micromonospora sp. NBC_01638]|uniref:hypothetical protein n=1 Tax=Micromonospora sp. NBC_01638 TaxID=2975982 RepID=UPI0038706045|nr:hypothetical protein OG811_22855 [Micromonospora sp. NBC_01638]
MHGELLTLGVKIAASMVWEMLRVAGIGPAPGPTATTWATSSAPRPPVLAAGRG